MMAIRSLRRAASLLRQAYRGPSRDRVAVEAPQALGGATVVLATVTEPSAMTAAIDGLRARGELVVAGASPDKIQVSAYQLISGQKTLRGHASGTAREVEETMRFAALSGVRPISEQVRWRGPRPPSPRCWRATPASAWCLPRVTKPGPGAERRRP
jgi:D-arabinose 1-dehydrogenase-like Zn-dependent alcohol dehydrogenase